jgi:hypothetical protein
MQEQGWVYCTLYRQRDDRIRKRQQQLVEDWVVGNGRWEKEEKEKEETGRGGSRRRRSSTDKEEKEGAG